VLHDPTNDSGLIPEKDKARENSHKNIKSKEVIGKGEKEVKEGDSVVASCIYQFNFFLQ
jgi:hypothetical protein